MEEDGTGVQGKKKKKTLQAHSTKNTTTQTGSSATHELFKYEPCLSAKMMNKFKDCTLEQCHDAHSREGKKMTSENAFEVRCASDNKSMAINVAKVESPFHTTHSQIGVTEVRWANYFLRDKLIRTPEVFF